MLSTLAADQRTLVLRFFATDAEAEVRSEEGIPNDDVARLVVHAGALAMKVWNTVPRDNPATQYANVVVGWAATKLLTPDYWRFGQQLVKVALDLSCEEPIVLSDSQRMALEDAQRLGHFDSPGDRLGSLQNALERSAPRLTITRDEGDDEGGWPVITLTYEVKDPAVDESSAALLAEEALAAMPIWPFGKLFVGRDGRLLYRVDVFDDPNRALVPDALRSVAWVAVRDGLRFAGQFAAQPSS